MLELNIDLNMRVELSKEAEAGMNLRQVKKVGIENLGNTCYASSVWQIINHMKLHESFINN